MSITKLTLTSINHNNLGNNFYVTLFLLTQTKEN